jgi:uncharacterized protein (TIGR02145 family)
MAGRIGPIPKSTVVIGTQEWMIRNLDVTTYRDGTEIPEVTDNATWSALTTGAWCYHSNNSANDPIYGKLYNWYAVTNAKGLAPIGYHVPLDTEYTTLSNYLGGLSVAGGKMKEAGTTYWTAPNTGATNSSGWTGLPGGLRFSGGAFFSTGGFASWWSSTEFSPTSARYRYMFANDLALYTDVSLKNTGLSVRCIKD